MTVMTDYPDQSNQVPENKNTTCIDISALPRALALCARCGLLWLTAWCQTRQTGIKGLASTARVVDFSHTAGNAASNPTNG